MNKTSNVFLILILSVLLCSKIFFVYAEENSSRKILFDDDFSEQKNYVAITGTYTDSDGIGNSAPAILLQKNQRLTHQVAPVSSGVYVVSFDFMKPDNGENSAFMEITDKSGGNIAAYLGCTGSEIYLNCYDSEGNGKSVILDRHLKTNKWYNFSLTIDIDHKNIRVYIDGRRVGSDNVCYFNPNISTIGRFFDSRCYSSDYYIDNIMIYEDLIAEQISFSDIYMPAIDLTLPTSGKTFGSITWESSYEMALSDEGVICSIPDYDTTVTLTATFTNGNVSEKRDYNVYLKGSVSRVVEFDELIEEISSTGNYTMPTAIGVKLFNGNVTQLPVVWDSYPDMSLMDEEQMIHGVVANGAAFVTARITVSGGFDVKRICFVDKNGKSVIRMVKNGNISGVVIKKYTDDIIDGNIYVYIMDEYEEIIDTKEIPLSAFDECSVNGYGIIPVDITVSSENTGICYIKVEIIDTEGNMCCKPYIYECNNIRDDEAKILIASDSVISGKGRHIDPNNANIRGWSEVLQHFFDDNVTVADFSTPNIKITRPYNKKTVFGAVSENDYVIVHYGNTDSSCRKFEYPTAEEFEEALILYLNEIMDKKAYPILMAPISTSESYMDLNESYEAVIRNVSTEYKIPLIDISDKIKHRFDELTHDVYWEDGGHYLTRDGAAQVAKHFVEEFDGIETFVDGYIRYDVVNSAENPENHNNASYRVHRLHLYDVDGNEVYKFSNADKINAVSVELISDVVKPGTIFVAIYDNDKFEFVNGHAILVDEEWKKYKLKTIPVNIDISKYETLDVKVMMFADNLFPYSNVYQLSRIGE